MTKTKAAYYEQFGRASDVLKIGEFYIDDPKENEVQVEIITSGINPSDTKIRQGARGQFDYSYVIPHSDGAGIIIKIGKKVQNFKVGDRVWIYNAGWQRQHGTACSLLNLPEELVVKLPKKISFETGACLGVSALTAAACLLSLDIQPGKTIMITGGAGMVGMMAIQMAKMLDLEVITTVSNREKNLIASQAGADYVINYNTENVADKIKEYTAGMLLDSLIDVDFGSNISWSIDAMAANSVIASYASAHKPIVQLPFYSMMFKQIALKPVFVYILSETMRKNSIKLVQKALKKNLLKPIIYKIYSLEEVAQAHVDVENKNRQGHVLITNYIKQELWSC